MGMPKVRARVRILCVAAAALAVSAWLVARDAPARALRDEVLRGPGATVDLARVAPFAWDRVFIFGPYTPNEEIQERLGFRWEGVDRTSIMWSEDIHLLVFVRDGEVAYWFEHPRKYGDFVVIGGDGGCAWLAPASYARDEATFEVVGGPGLSPRIAKRVNRAGD